MIIERPKVMPLCKCDCGKIIVWKCHMKWVRRSKYIRGHNPQTEKQKKILLKINTERKYTKHSEETKQKIRNTLIKKGIMPPIIYGKIPWNKGIKWLQMQGKNHPMYGKKCRVSKCQYCGAFKGLNHNCSEIIEKARVAKIGKNHSEEHKKKLSNITKQMWKNPIIRNKIIKNLRKKVQTEEYRKKMRIKMLEYIKKIRKNSLTNVGNNEKQILDEIELSNNIKINRAFQIIGYHPDGYYHKSNIIFEVDEKYHRQEIRKIKDKIRQARIQKELNCQFIRIPDNF